MSQRTNGAQILLISQSVHINAHIVRKTSPMETPQLGQNQSRHRPAGGRPDDEGASLPAATSHTTHSDDVKIFFLMSSSVYDSDLFWSLSNKPGTIWSLKISRVQIGVLDVKLNSRTRIVSDSNDLRSENPEPVDFLLTDIMATSDQTPDTTSTWSDGCHPRRKPLLKSIDKKTCKQFAEDMSTKDKDYWNQMGGLYNEAEAMNIYHLTSMWRLLPPIYAVLFSESMSELRVVLLGSNWYQRNFVVNFILGVDDFNYEAQSCVRISGKVENMKIAVINTPDLQFPTADSLTEFIRDCAKLSAPGPHVFLLVLQPESFTEEEKNRIYRVLETFSDRSFDHSFVLILKPKPQNRSNPLPGSINEALIKELIRKCRYRRSQMEYIERPELLTRFGQIVKENNREHVRYKEFKEARSSFEDSHQNQRENPATGSDDPSA
ncbi:hypothetical protein CCH79_00016211, partial [Gambusia affinis]